jgi:hypothetical protein
MGKKRRELAKYGRKNNMTPEQREKLEKRKKSYIGYAPIGSHGHLFYFESGYVAERYPTLYEIYRKKLLPNWKKVRITIEEI